ncbi:MAG: glycosyl transferase [Acidobacteriota bacterium]|nr:glycosyl transferase [Acidobacteriota bacterium]
MGDVLHAMPAVFALRAARPDWRISWAIEPRWSPLLAAAEADGLRGPSMPLVDRWHGVATGEWKRRPFSLWTAQNIAALRHELRAGSYDICVDMQGLIRSSIIGRMVGASLYAGPADPREREARWLYGKQVRRSAAHVIEQGCELLGGAVDLPLAPARVELPVDHAAAQWCDGYLRSQGLDRFVVMAPTAGWGAKQWPVERFGAVATELGRAGFRTLVNASSDRDEMARRLVEASNGFAIAVPCSISELIEVLRRAAAMIAGDTGPLHMAAALGRPVVGIYGPTDPARTGPYGTEARVLRDPSSVTNHKRASEPEAGLLRIGVEQVASAALDLLAEVAANEVLD